LRASLKDGKSGVLVVKLTENSSILTEAGYFDFYEGQSTDYADYTEQIGVICG